MSSPPRPHIACLSFLGTAEHRERSRHAIQTFHECMGGPAVAGTRLFDGPGSAPLTADSPDPTPGTYLYDAISDTKLPNPTAARALRDTLKEIDGQLTGEGVDDLLLEATLYIEQLKKDNPALDTVNLQGFSRGADTCMRMANVLNRLYPELKVNLFLVDPVPGPGRRDDPDSWLIPPNVEKVEVALMLHEYRPGFDPQHAARYVVASPEKTQVTMLPWYGSHSSGLRLDDRPHLNQTPLLLLSRFLDFCRSTGSIPQGVTPEITRWVPPGQDEVIPGAAERLPKTPEERLALYNAMRLNEWVYARGTRLNTRRILTQHESSVKNSEVFVNEEHRTLFKQCLPKAFSWFFEGNINQHTREEVFDELSTLDSDYRDHFFQHAIKTPLTDASSLPEPRGVAHAETSTLGRAPASPDNAFETLRFNLQSRVNFYQYHHPDAEKTSADNHAASMISNALLAVRTQTPAQGLQTLQTCMHALKNPEYAGAQFFNAAPVARKTHAQVFAEQLEGYVKSNRFWRAVRTVLETFGLPCPASISDQKESVARNLAESARELDRENRGDDPKAMKELLAEGSTLMKALYAGNPELGIFRSRIDRILQENHAKVHKPPPAPAVDAGSAPRIMAN